MEYPPSMSSDNTPHKRPRSPTNDQPLPAAKIPRTSPQQLQINYLVRQHKETIPLVSTKLVLPEILGLIGEYDGVLQRHESLAGNLGACPLGPILLKRFERLFDGPPKILKSHAKDANVTWLDVVEFAQNKPEQFNLEKTRNGVRVCQFYTKQCRVEISEEDYVLIHSKMPQKLIPPQPILEDEEKELGIIDLLDRNLGQVIQLADQVSARARQLIHKMKNRRSAIIARREAVKEMSKNATRSNGSPFGVEDVNGLNTNPVRSIEMSLSPPQGFTAVNVRQSIADGDRRPETSQLLIPQPEEFYPGSSTQNITYINGRSIKGASPTQRAELMKSFLTHERDQAVMEESARRASLGTPRGHALSFSASEPRPRSDSIEIAGMNLKHAASVAIPNTPAALMPQVKPSPLDRDDGGPFKTEMVNRMESMHRGDRVIPPCDRCRRLHMDCLKNLTACMGCTKKHAKCSWKDVKPEELHATAFMVDREHGQSSAREVAAPISAGSTIEVARAVEESMQPQHTTAATTFMETQRSDNDRAGGNRSTANPDSASALMSPTFHKPDPPEPSSATTAKFDVRPPPLLNQQSYEPGHQRSPSQSTVPHPYSPMERDNPDRNDRDMDEGDRLQALAASVYRSASQSAKPLE